MLVLIVGSGLCTLQSVSAFQFCSFRMNRIIDKSESESGIFFIRILLYNHGDA